MGDERTSRSTASDGLQRRGLHLCVASLVEHATDSAHYCCTLKECVLHTVVNDEVYVALTETQLRIFELVVSHAVLILHDRQRLEALREQSERLSVY